ncbi:RteC protein [Epilithonimonas bovis DSM 19482]|uniref:RteC protein n=1 Tax=Epilithonimonas bovis DSM 19482 TaxID=1121284 RepID=A0A1U7PVY3_9FLAO|nr:RteC domain-containing protein [Epilithonimonas bovis]SIT97715.1 RteC protein [Epilithonimonas bovis DSM 19482]
MTTDEILKQSEELWQSLLRTIEKKERENLPPVTRYQHLLMEADQAISILKGMVAHHTFDATAQEVYFFKILKPRFSAKFILYSKILALITTRPHGSYKALRRICDDELDYLHYSFRIRENL